MMRRMWIAICESLTILKSGLNEEDDVYAARHPVGANKIPFFSKEILLRPPDVFNKQARQQYALSASIIF